jgi:hypothetical protein
MATYVEIAALRRSPVLKDKVSVAVSIAAIDIRNEAESAPNHRARKRWADQAMINPEGHADAMLWAVLGNPAIQSNGEASPDGDIQFVVNSLIDVFAQ